MRSLGVLEQPGGAQGSHWDLQLRGISSCEGSLAAGGGAEQGGQAGARGLLAQQAAEQPLQPCSVCVC